MVVGYALGNKRDSEEDIPVIGETDPDVLTYSKSLTIILSRTCRNDCPYCAFHRKDNLTVPYSTIKVSKSARSAGAREVLFAAGERPDKIPHIRAMLDLWGFKSYLEYMYTVAELSFLEGLIPVLEVGFLTPVELQRMSEMCAAVKIMLDSVDDSQAETVYANSPGKRLESRLRSLEWAGRLRFPAITGVMVGIGESNSHRKHVLQEIAKLHNQYKHVHEVLIQNFVPQKGTPWSTKKPPSKADMLNAVEQAMSILPADIKVTFPLELNPNIEDFIKVGIRDLGRITAGNPLLFPDQPPLTEVRLAEIAEKMGFR
ncbi:MAG: 7,8-didemethyl-8-hydroxy-5-deazariboflavin synthase subunit CofG, partial [Candidatus Margulisiibacteriota bacterium]